MKGSWWERGRATPAPVCLHLLAMCNGHVALWSRTDAEPWASPPPQAAVPQAGSAFVLPRFHLFPNA